MRGDSASRVIRPAESQTLRMRERSMHENREIPAVLIGRPRRPPAGRSGKACGHNPDAYAAGKSDTSIVPMNAGNKAAGRGTVGYGGTVNPPRHRKSGAGNPPPAAGRVAWSGGPRTGRREGWGPRGILDNRPRAGHGTGHKRRVGWTGYVRRQRLAFRTQGRSRMR